MTSIQEKIIKPKLGLLDQAEQLGSVSQACNVLGYSRDSFYHFKELYEQGCEEPLMDLSRKKPILKNRVQEHVERAVVELAIENPALGQKRASWELQRKGIMVSSSGVRSIWLRNDLETMKKRLKALEACAAQEGILLIEEQMERKKKPSRRRKPMVRLGAIAQAILAGKTLTTSARKRAWAGLDLSRFDAAPLIAFTATKETDYETETDEFRQDAVRIALTSG